MTAAPPPPPPPPLPPPLSEGLDPPLNLYVDMGTFKG